MSDIIKFDNASIIEPIYPSSKSSNARSKQSKYLTYFCKLCNTTHYIKINDSYFKQDEWCCKASVDKTRK